MQRRSPFPLMNTIQPEICRRRAPVPRGDPSLRIQRDDGKPGVLHHSYQARQLALATGVVDSYMSSLSTGYDSKTFESIKNWYDTQAWLPKNAVIVNRKAFEALDKPSQQALQKAAADAEARGWKLSEEKNGWYLDQLRQKGMTIVKPTEQLTADLRKVGNFMLADWQKKAGPDGKKVTAPQVAKLLKRQLTERSRNSIKDSLGAVDDVIAMTDRVIEIQLVAPRPNLLSLLAQPELAVLRDDRFGTGWCLGFRWLVDGHVLCAPHSP